MVDNCQIFGMPLLILGYTNGFQVVRTWYNGTMVDNCQIFGMPLLILGYSNGFQVVRT